MKLHGSYPFATTPELLWTLVLDPQVLRHIVPGCQAFTAVTDTRYTGQLLIRLGPMAGLYEGTLTLNDVQPGVGYAFSFHADSQSSSLWGNGRVRLEAQDGLTILHYEGQAQVDGELETHATPLLETTARSIIRQSLERLGQNVQATMLAGVAPILDEMPYPSPSFSPLDSPAGHRLPLSVANWRSLFLFGLFLIVGATLFTLWRKRRS
jgi:2-furoyl-CoA dehydrogenase large subunit